MLRPVQSGVCPSCHSIVEEPARFCPYCGQRLDTTLGAPERIENGSELILDELAHVQVGERLGEGGMGVVHRAWLDYLPTGRLAGTPGHPIAVKVLRPELRGRERARRMFLREAVALERLAHPNIVRFIALYERERHLAIAMEYVHGEPLSQIVHGRAARRASPRAACLPIELAWHYQAQLLGALAAVHALGILHRDVKAANVLVRPDGVAKLTDFGIARLPESDARNTGGMIPGTGAYMAPEQVRGEAIDARADLYAAAVVFYEMLTGRTPFDSPQRDELMVRTAQLEEPPPPIGQQIDGVPPALDVVMAHALAKDRQHRYGTAVELGDALRDALRVVPVAAWVAQREFAGLARTLSEPVPAASPELIEHAERLRTAMMTPNQS